MKKLIAMIGAVATAFGLYAAGPFSISFETAEQAKGVDTEEMTFTPASPWAWAGDTLKLSAYADGETLPYGEGAFARRDGSAQEEAPNMFDGEDSNVNYLKLETGTNALTRTAGYDFLDQLVKFTGFEEYQTNVVAGTKIAVWMSGIETEGTEGEDGYIAGETNLYVTCGKVADGEVEPIALKIDKIDGDYELDKWYRLTIKSLGNIFGESQEVAARAGFIIYVNGHQVSSTDAEATDLIDTVSYMTAETKNYMAARALFPAIDNSNATFAQVGYQGIGAIDDIILDDDGPKFCEAITPSILLADGVVIDKVLMGGAPLPPPYAVPSGTEITIYLKAAEGMKIKAGATTEYTVTVTGDENEFDYTDVEAEEVVAKKNGTIELAESELLEALGALVEGDKVVFVANCALWDEGEENQLYSFYANTTITATKTGWEILIGNVDEEAGYLEVFEDIASGKALSIAFEEGYEGTIALYSYSVEGVFEAVNGTVEVVSGVELGEGATFKAAAFDFDTDGTTITLTGAGKVITPNGELADYILDEESNPVVPEYDEDTELYTYALATEPTTYEVTVAPANPNSTVTVAIGEEEPEERFGKIDVPVDETVVVTYTPDEGYQIVEEDKDKAEWTFTAESESKETEAPRVELIPPTTYTVDVPAAANTTVAVQYGQVIDNTNGVYTIEAGTAVAVQYTAVGDYRITANASTNIAALAEDVVVTAPTVEAIVYKASITIGDSTNKYEDVAEAFAALQAAEADPANFPIVVTAIGEALTFPYEGQSITLGAGETITIDLITTGESWKFSNLFAGTVTLAEGSVIIAKGLADGAKINPPEGDFEIAVSEPVDGYITYSVAQSAPAVAVAIVVSADGVTTNEFTDLAAAIAAAQAGETVALLDNVEVGATLRNEVAITLDLNGKTLTRATDATDFMLVAGADLTIMNGTINGGSLKVLDIAAGSVVLGDGLYVTAAINCFLKAYTGVLTIGAGCVVEAANDLLDADQEATVNIYGTMTRLHAGAGRPLMWASCVAVNVYAGAVMSSADADVIRSNAGATIINIYGGTISSTGGYSALYSYNAATATKYTIYGGMISTSGGDIHRPIFDIRADAVETTVTPFDDQCKAKFNFDMGLANYCAEGYGLKLVDGWYEIAQLPVVELVNAGNKGTVVLDQTIGTSVAFGGTVSGTVTANEGYTPFVFVDGQKVTVGQDGAFTGIANDSGKVVVTYAKDSAWYLDPFKRVENKVYKDGAYTPMRGLMSEDSAYYVFGIGPGNYDEDCYGGYVNKIADLTTTLNPDFTWFRHNNGQYKSNQETFRDIAFSSVNNMMVSPARMAANPYAVAYPLDGDWEGANDARYNIPNDLGLPAFPAAFGVSGEYYYGRVIGGDWNNYTCQFKIIKDENGKITNLETNKFWQTGGAVALHVYQKDGHDIVYVAMGPSIKVFDTTSDEVKDITIPGCGTIWSVGISGRADGVLHMTLNTGSMGLCVFALNDDMMSLASTTPIASFNAAQLGLNQQTYSAPGVLDDESMLFMPASNPGNKVSFTVYQKRPANLIVRGTFSDEENAEDDVLVAYGESANVAFTAPIGKKITAVKVNGVADANFTDGTYTFTSAALSNNVYVAMTTADLPPVARVTIGDIVTTNYDLHAALVAGSVGGAKVELLANVDLTGVAWEPVANFAGTFDGAGYTISNLGITMASGNFVGLFANCVGGEGKPKPVIKNFTIENVDIKAENSTYVAAVVANGVGLISNVTVRGSIKIAGVKYVAGIDGHPNTTIVDCKVIGDGAATSFIGANTTAAAQVGGIYGMGPATEAVQVYNCSVEGVTIQAKEHAGGIGGRAQGDVVNVNCTVKNVIVKAGTNAGQLIGQPYGYEGGYNATDYLLNCTVDNVALQDATGAAIADAEYGSGFGSASQLNFIKSSNAVGTGLATAGAKFGLTGGDFTIVNEWSTLPGQAYSNLMTQCAAGYTPIANQDGTYTIKQVWDVTFYVGDVVSNAQVVVNGECAKEFAYDTETIEAWTNAAGVAFAFTTPITETTTLYAQLKAAGPVIPVDDEKALDDAGKAAAAEVAEVFGDDLATWVEKVYGDGGKIPASKLNGTTSELIAIAQAYDLPIMTEPEVEIEKAAEGDGFTFQIVDDGTPVAMQAAKVLSMVQFTADLGVAFDAATTDNVEVALSTDKKTATATFKKATNAGFMKVKLATPTK